MVGLYEASMEEQCGACSLYSFMVLFCFCTDQAIFLAGLV